MLWTEEPLGTFFLEKAVESVPEARARARTLGPVESSPKRDDILLVVSELVTNAVVHSDLDGSKIAVSLMSGRGLIIVEVRDPGSMLSDPHVKRSDSLMGDHGRGLILVEEVCDKRWGTYISTDGERVVWAALPTADDAPSAEEITLARRKQRLRAVS